MVSVFLGKSSKMKVFLFTLSLLAPLADFVSAQLVSFGEFQNACTWNGFPAPPPHIYDAFMAELWRSSISTKVEAAMAITQFMHESDGFRAVREYACEHAGCPGQYETPGCDIGGQRYFGRGFIQLTWCSNYRDASFGLYGSDWLIYDADAVARDFYVAWQTAMWYWQARVHSFPGVPQEQFGSTTRAINGALECDGGYQHIARKRFEMYVVVRNALNLGGSGDERGCYN